MFRFASVALLAVVVLSAGPALAVKAPPLTPSTPPRPSVDNYPDRAAKAHVEGWAKVQCTVQATGRLADCVVLAEAPQGYGFGAATVKSATETGKADLSKDGPGKRVVITSQFALPGR